MLSPGCWTLKRDESKHRLLLLLHVVNQNLRVRSGLFGWERCAITDAVTKTEQPRAAIQTFATPRAGYLKAGVVNASLFDKLQAHLEFMVTDAAASELLSIKMMQMGHQPG